MYQFRQGIYTFDTLNITVLYHALYTCHSGGIKLAKNILIINGATRKNGNTDIIINKIIEGSLIGKVKINLIKLRNKEISDCIGCYTCYKQNKCSINDDMKEILDSINRSDMIIFASPIFITNACLLPSM